MPLWTGLVIGWITICTNATPPNARWGMPPVTMYPTQAACVEAIQTTNVTLAKVWKAAGRKDPLTMTCWCEHVTPARGLTMGDFVRACAAAQAPTGPTAPIQVGP